MRRDYQRVLIYLFLIVFANPSRAETLAKMESNSCCGLYATYAGLYAVGRKIDFKRLLLPRYMGSLTDGSSVDELATAISDNGGGAVTLTDLTPDELQKLSCPAILHVKSYAGSLDYDHFVLLLSQKDGKATILDGPSGIKTIPLRSLKPVWDGIAIAIYRSPAEIPNLQWLKAFDFLKTFEIVSGCFIVLLLCRTVIIHYNFTSKHRSLADGAAIATLSIAAALILHYSEGGFFVSPEAMKDVEDAHADLLARHLDSKAVAGLMKSGVVVVDARDSQNFSNGHLPGARNIFFGDTPAEVENQLADVKKSQQIVVYCQSSKCTYSGILARKLASRGFEQILIYQDGWEGWETYSSQGVE